jgi:hypothetical protein
MSRERAIRKEIADSDRATQEEIRRIDAEIASINARKTEFIHIKEGKIIEKETAEDQVRDLYHQAKCTMERANENVSPSLLFLTLLEPTHVLLPPEGELHDREYTAQEG